MRGYSGFALLVYAVGVLIPTAVQGYSIRSLTQYNTTTLENIEIYTPAQKVRPSAEFNITFTIGLEERPIKLALRPNHDLILNQPHINFLGGDGGLQRSERLQRNSHKVFRGSVFAETTAFRWERVGWARINVLRDGFDPLFSGAFSLSGVQYEIKIESVSTDQGDRQMVVYRDSESAEPPIPHTAWSEPIHLFRRQNLLDSSDMAETIGDTSGCPSSRRVALMGIATDCVYTSGFDTSDDLIQSLVTMVNTASEIFESSFNIALSLNNITIEEEDCPSTASSDTPWNVGCGAGDLNWRLGQFTQWRGQIRNDDNAYWTLMSGCPTGTEVGVSWVGELCNEEMGANVVGLANNQWQVFAHESGHTFGAYHDCDASTCSLGQCCPLSSTICDAGGQYIMNPVSTSPQTEFSECTIGNVCSSMQSGRVSTQCLTTNAAANPTIDGGECGNGIVEVGEDCDCGDDCDNNPCCNGATCQFIGDAVCDDSSGSCCQDCQFASSGTVCRAATSECDTEETCPGDSGDCPDDEYETNGQSCGDGDDRFCSSGQCTNRNLQCQAAVNGDNSTISACGNSTCTLQCSSGWAGSTSCSNVGDVLDGTPCDTGLCQNGVCRSSTQDDDQDDGESWVDENRDLIIGLSAGIGGFIVLSLLACIAYCCCCRRKPKTVPVATQTPLRPMPHGYYPPPAYTHRPPPQQQWQHPQQHQTPFYRYA
ncbi:Metallo-peptidase family M12-domain-containing protein [Aspergillus karnatakaensis]|uniref:ADAM family of metalloprotease ADM-A n=1 Tax=Aspergillus karnatakaensis TaxID=1810916 RepID=UPI003CCCFB7E